MSTKNLSVKEFKEKIKETPDAVVLDVRTPGEVAEGAIPGHKMINIANPEAVRQIQELDKDKPYFIYCRSGSRSMSVCNYMAAQGFKEVYNLDGGIIAWNREN